MVALGAGEAEQPLLEDRVLPIPERQCEAEPLPVVADAEQPIFVPAIGPRAGVVVWVVVPGAAIRAVVLAHCAPRALAQVWPPTLPGRTILLKSVMLCCHPTPLEE